jgi:hypothetical protein
MAQEKDDRRIHSLILGILEGKRHIVLIVSLMILTFVVLHAAAAHFVYKAIGLSLKSPLSYWLLGGLLLVLALKFLFLWRFRQIAAKHFKK